MTLVLTALVKLLVLDLVFLFVMLALVVLLASGRRVAYAVLKRNFYGYFSNPTGYVFLCLFVLLTSMAAFWPDEFFSSNLGTLGQLNKWFTYIMMFFIPAITMSIWAEEKRQGTDELLLTLPADDFDIVAGKYVAATAIYTVSLLFSQLSTFMVLALLTQGEIDTGLFFTNYLGYWFIGLAMISIGMVASFLTSNLTVGFILGALFNAPLAFAFIFDNVFAFFFGAGSNRSVTREIKNLGIQERFDDFGRGVLSLSGMSYFLLVAAFGVYLCMVLIGKRHWSGGRDGNVKLAHFLLRIALLFVLAIGGSILFRNKDLIRSDVTENKVSSLSPVTVEMIQTLGRDRDIVVDAYLSDEVPEQYARIKYQIVSLLKEFESTAKASGVAMQVRIYDNIRPSSEEEKLAEQQYGILPQMISVRERGAYSDQPVLLGAAFRSGLQKVVIPFFEPGVPVEYELVRSLTTVAKPARKKLGIVKTDAKLMGGFDQRTFQSQPQHPIVEELAKQYEVIDVNASSPIDTEKYDVLLAVQPSSLGPEEMINFTSAVTAGVPTAIFEDPVVVAFDTIPGTGDPKQAPGGMMGMMGGGGPQPKGDIRPLWRALGLEIPGRPGMQGGFSPDLCWQEYNPYPILAQTSQATDLWIFASESAPYAEDALSENSEITKGLKEVMFLYAGVLLPAKDAETKFTPLIKTGRAAGNMPKSEIDSIQRSGLSRATELQIRRGKEQGEQVLAALLEGETPKEGATAGKRPIKAVYVTDIDCMSEVFVNIRNKKSMMEEINFQFQNITFILNTVDVLVDETRYPQVRRHVPTYSTLKLVEVKAEEARREEAEKQTEFQNEYNKAVAAVEEENAKSERVLKDEIEKLQAIGSIDQESFKKLQEKVQYEQLKKMQMTKKFKVEKDRLERTRDQGIREARRQSDDAINKIQNYYKLLAVFIPPIPPLLVGIIVMVSRRLREREGISKSRLR
ncbi:MAG: Gldg family protein [Planctomycetota bacterium]|nr:Gldg family protein [Planctomycetota bacterium]